MSLNVIQYFFNYRRVGREAMNIPGLIVVAVFYIIILATGIWASRRSKQEEKKSTGTGTEVILVAGRNMNIIVGIFTMTGESPDPSIMKYTHERAAFFCNENFYCFNLCSTWQCNYTFFMAYLSYIKYNKNKYRKK